MNPEVARIASEYFTYLEDARGQTEIVLGDARLSLERELETGEARLFDVLAVDAFRETRSPFTCSRVMLSSSTSSTSIRTVFWRFTSAISI